MAHPVPKAPALRLESLSAGSRVVVLVSGDVDALTAPQLEAFMAEHPLIGCTVLELDLSGVISLGSAGLTVLLGVRRWCEQRGIELWLRGASRSVGAALELTGLDRLFADHGAGRRSAGEQQLALF